MSYLKLSECFLSFLLAVLFGIASLCSADQAIPAYSSPVVDTLGILSNDERSSIVDLLAHIEKTKGSQIAVLIVATTEPETIEQYGIRVADAWKPGRKNVDDGVILIVAKSDRTVRIEVGRGLEGVLTDAVSKRIIEEAIVPQFRSGSFFGGIRDGVGNIVSVISGEPLPPPPPQQQSDPTEFMPLLIFFGLFLSSIFRTALGRLIGSSALGVLAFVVSLFFFSAFVAALIALVSFVVTFFGLSGSGRSRSRGGWSTGGSSSGGGGGFSGGGGGGFSGGGASGRW